MCGRRRIGCRRARAIARARDPDAERRTVGSRADDSRNEKKPTQSVSRSAFRSRMREWGHMDHIREHRSALASAERRLLVFIAGRLPRWVTSDCLTLLALVSMPAAGLAFATIGTRRWGAAAVTGALL